MTKRRTLVLSILLVFFGYFTSFGQNFEGTVEFKVKATGDMADQLQQMMPQKYTWHFKDGKFVMEMDGGMAAAMLGNRMLYNGEQSAYFINDAQKTAYEIKLDEVKDEAEPEVKVEDLKKTETIAGHKCKKYKVTVNSPKGSQVSWLWVAEDINIKPPKSNKVGQGFIYKEIKGFPLKTMTEMKELGANIIMEATKVEKKKLDPSTFEVPKDYKIKDFEELQKQMGGY